MPWHNAPTSWLLNPVKILKIPIVNGSCISVVPKLCNRRLCAHRQAATHLSPRHRHMVKNGGF